MGLTGRPPVGTSLQKDSHGIPLSDMILDLNSNKSSFWNIYRICLVQVHPL